MLAVLGCVPSGSCRSRAGTGGSGLCVFNYHERYTHTTSQPCTRLQSPVSTALGRGRTPHVDVLRNTTCACTCTCTSGVLAAGRTGAGQLSSRPRRRSPRYPPRARPPRPRHHLASVAGAAAGRPPRRFFLREEPAEAEAAAAASWASFFFSTASVCAVAAHAATQQPPFPSVYAISPPSPHPGSWPPSLTYAGLVVVGRSSHPNMRQVPSFTHEAAPPARRLARRRGRQSAVPARAELSWRSWSSVRWVLG